MDKWPDLGNNSWWQFLRGANFCIRGWTLGVPDCQLDHDEDDDDDDDDDGSDNYDDDDEGEDKDSR